MFTLLCCASSLLAAESTPPTSERISKNIVEAMFYQEQIPLLQMLSQNAIGSTNSALSIEELIAKYNKQRENAAFNSRYSSSVNGVFTPEEQIEVLSLLENPLYIKYYQKLGKLDFALINETTQILTEIAAETPNEKPLGLVNTAASEDSFIHVTSGNVGAIKALPLPVVIDVYADWCGPCKALAPHFLAASKEFEGKCIFVKLNVQEDEALAQSLGVKALPTLLFVNKGEVVTRQEGCLGYDVLKAFVEKGLSNK